MKHTHAPKSQFVVAALAALLVLAGSLVAQPGLVPADSMLAYRAIENLRVWTFTYQAQDMGRLVSYVAGLDEVNGQPAVRLEREFNIDYNLLNENRTAAVKGESFVAAANGVYLGDDIDVTTDSLTERLTFEVDGDELSGFFTRGGREVERTVAWPNPAYAWDPNLIDQLEMYLAFQPVSVGGQFTDSIFQPQSLLWTQIAGYCDDYYYKEIYRGKFDTVYAIHLTAPTPMDLFFTPDRELVRADFLRQAIRVYQDVNARAQPEGQRRAPSEMPGATGRFSLERIGQYAGYLLIGLFGLLFFVRTFFRYVESYLAMAAGVAALVVVLLTQMPLQERLLAAADETLSLISLLPPAAVAAAIQELLKLIAIGLLLRLFRPQPGRSTAIGAAVGTAFGVVEAIYMAGLSAESVSFWFVLRDGSLILFHIVSGFLLGYALGRSGTRWLSMLGLTFVLHLVLRFLPTFSYVGSLDYELVAMFMAVLVLIVVIMVLLVRPRLDERA